MAKTKKKAEETKNTEIPETDENTVGTEQTEAAEEAAQSDKSEDAKLAEELAETKDKLLRTVAEYDNFRKRSQKEKEAIYGDSKAEVIGKLLPVVDNFERAAAAADTDLENYRKGIEMTVKQLLDVFSSLGVEPFGEKGEEFDPNLHNGVMHVDDEELGENVIADVFMKGYKMGDRVVRHATVKVAN